METRGIERIRRVDALIFRGEATRVAGAFPSLFFVVAMSAFAKNLTSGPSRGPQVAVKPTARIYIDPYDVIEGVQAESASSDGARRVKRCVHAPAQQEAVYSPRGKERTRLDSAVFARDVADIIEPAVLDDCSLESAGDIRNRGEDPVAVDKHVIFAVGGSPVSSCDFSIVIALPRLRESRRAREVNRSVNSPAQQEAVHPDFVEIPAYNVAVGVNPRRYSGVTVGELQQCIFAATQQESEVLPIAAVYTFRPIANDVAIAINCH